jgi:hypothetical protein
MKKIAIAILLCVCFPVMVHACDIVVGVDGVKKERYKAGDVVVLKITVVLEHRNCDTDIKETDIAVSGCQITAATAWVNTSGKTWERKIKIKITDDKAGKAIVTAKRDCDRDGGQGSLTLISGD